MTHEQDKPLDKSDGTSKSGELKEEQQTARELSDKYTDGEGGIADQVREINPNRNVDKTDATNAGGYRN